MYDAKYLIENRAYFLYEESQLVICKLNIAIYYINKAAPFLCGIVFGARYVALCLTFSWINLIKMQS